MLRNGDPRDASAIVIIRNADIAGLHSSRILIDREGVVVPFSDDVVVTLSNILVVPAIAVNGTNLTTLN